MSGFSDEWLTARAAWDAPARSRPVEAALSAWTGTRTTRLSIIDLGAGNGNNQRHLAPLLGLPIDWVLVDNDPALLAAAERNAVLKDGDSIACVTADLVNVDLADLIGGADLVTASALFDLVSRPWLGRLLDVLEERRTALFAVLTYDGRMEAGADSDEFGTTRHLFNRHQKTDKGFGAALGPEAAAALSAGLLERSYEVVEGPSDWVLRAADAGVAELVSGWVAAASEMAPEKALELTSWGADLLADSDCLIRVGHRDHFGVPLIR